jgi:hypothetical protein
MSFTWLQPDARVPADHWVVEISRPQTGDRVKCDLGAGFGPHNSRMALWAAADSDWLDGHDGPLLAISCLYNFADGSYNRRTIGRIEHVSQTLIRQ